MPFNIAWTPRRELMESPLLDMQVVQGTTEDAPELMEVRLQPKDALERPQYLYKRLWNVVLACHLMTCERIVHEAIHDWNLAELSRL